MKEVWKKIDDYHYEVSNLGRFRNSNNGHILKQTTLKDGYYMVSLCKGGKGHSFKAHRFVAKAFIPNPNNYEQVNHKNEIKTDNRVENLEWCTRQYNYMYGTRNKRSRETFMKNNPPRKVEQYTKDGKYIQTFRGAKEAQEKTNICMYNIYQCLVGKLKTSGGYVWKYVNR